MKMFCQLLFLFSLFGAVNAQEASVPTGPTEAANKAMAKIVLMRSKSILNGTNPLNVWSGEVEVGQVWRAEFIQWEAAPGKLQVRIRVGGIALVRVSKIIEVDAVAGETVYLLADTPDLATFSLVAMPADEGRALYEKYKARVATWGEARNKIKIRE